MIAGFMNHPPHRPPDWARIDTVLLDLDGTLLDLAYDNYVWLGLVPERYAQARGLSIPEAQAELAPKFRAWAGKLEWYSIDFWSRELGLDILQLHRDEAARAGWLPGARGFLETLRARGKRLALMTNAHPSIVEIKHSRTGVLDCLDAVYTSHGFGAPKEDPRFWAAAVAAEGYDPSRTLFVDDSRAVLHSAIRSGLRWVYGVRRPDSSATAHRHEEFESVDGVVDLL
jgi:putative hydrolase of the HAD superfamily